MHLTGNEYGVLEAIFFHSAHEAKQKKSQFFGFEGIVAIFIYGMTYSTHVNF